MKKILITAGCAMAVTLLAFAAKKSDPVLMTVNGRQVPLSEFEYLYHKNNSQQLEPQTLEEYVDMFVNYKLKVADALNAHIDTTAAFIKEYGDFAAELAAPYMRDTTVLNQLVEEAYSHHLREVNVSHLMMPLAQTPEDIEAQRVLADSLRTAIANGTADWAEVCQQYSIDRGSNQKAGNMGWIMPGRLPWEFEKAAYDTPVGQMSPAINSGFGWHVVKPIAERAPRGEVRARHILKLTARKSPEEAAKAKEQIDSIYQLLLAGADFAELAKSQSEDPGSAARGGELDWFGSGMMVAEFDSAAFALPDSAISTPFQTSYGYHIVQPLQHRGVQSKDELRKQIEAQINNDERGMLPQRAVTERLLAKYNGQLNKSGLALVKKLITDNAGGYDSAMVAMLRVSQIPVAVAGNIKVPVSKAMEYVPATAATEADNAMRLITDAAQHSLEATVHDLEQADMLVNNPDYRNIAGEFRDGILLFEISNRNVWDRASKDKEGLQAFFDANRDKYAWDKPKFKGYIVFASTDSIKNLAEAYCDSINAAGNFDADTFIPALRARFGRDVKAERVVAAKGDNPISDFLAFDGPKPDDQKLHMKYFFTFRGKIADAPDEVADVRGAVTTDYQNELERQWIAQLRQKYPVKINQKVLKKVK